MMTRMPIALQTELNRVFANNLQEVSRTGPDSVKRTDTFGPLK